MKLLRELLKLNEEEYDRLRDMGKIKRRYRAPTYHRTGPFKSQDEQRQEAYDENVKKYGKPEIDRLDDRTIYVWTKEDGKNQVRLTVPKSANLKEHKEN